MEIPKIEKENCYTAIRMALCLLIIYEHTVELSGSSMLNLNLKVTAVYSFFCISGFWVTISYLKSKNAKEYFGKRIRRICPAYYITLLAQVIVGFFLTTDASAYWHNSRTWKYTLSNAIFLNFLYPSLPGVFTENVYGPEVNGSLWTMKIEVGFYVLLPLIVYVVRKIEKKRNQNIFLGLLCVLSFLYSVFFCVAKPTGWISKLGHQLPDQLIYFLAGMIFLMNYEWFRKYEKYLIFPAFLALMEKITFNIFWLSFLFPFALMIILNFVAYKFKNIGKIVKTDYSYVMYLTHYPLIQLFVSMGIGKACFAYQLLLALGASFFTAFMAEQAKKRIRIGDGNENRKN